MPLHIVIIGAGVIGLTCANLLQEAGHTVTLVARDFPAPAETIDPVAQINYTSAWGGAHNRWVPPPPAGPDAAGLAREHALAVATFARMTVLAAAAPAAGVTLLRGVEYLEAPTAAYRALTPARARALGMRGFRLLRPDELPDARVAWGCAYDTWCVNPMVYCAFLLRRAVRRGARAVRRELRAPAEAFALPGPGPAPDAVVDASGAGFGDDPAVFVTRGQTCLVANACADTVTRQNADGSWAFCVPRGFDGGTVIGGTKEPGSWDPEPSAEVREALLARFAETHPAILGPGGKLEVIADIVGRRPTRRGGPRIEAEDLGGKRVVVHAYGMGGRGYELSWGVAEEVVKLVEAHVGPGPKM